VFSQRELETIKSAAAPQNVDGVHQVSLEQSIGYRIRLFYTYWALKEAYIKMTGEALLAPWLRELEFTNVVVPKPTAERYNSGDCGSSVWGAPETGIQVWLHGEKVNEARIEVVAFERDYLIATAGRGGGFGNPTGDEAETMAKWDAFRRIDLEADISPCATGQCQCLV
jgi:4'-phosphopantetheinyl transferase